MAKKFLNNSKYVAAKSIPEVCRAFVAFKESSLYSNTRSIGGRLLLWDRCIAEWRFLGGEQNLLLSFAGFPSDVTKRRLNQLIFEINGTKPFFTHGGKNYFKTLACEVEPDEILKLNMSILTNHTTKTKEGLHHQC
jgi:hypothetical protein